MRRTGDVHITYLGLQFWKQLSKAKSSWQHHISSYAYTALTIGKIAPDSFAEPWIGTIQFTNSKENRQFCFVSGFVAFVLVNWIRSLKGPVVGWSVVSHFRAKMLSHFCRSWCWNMLPYTEQLGLLCVCKVTALSEFCLLVTCCTLVMRRYQQKWRGSVFLRRKIPLISWWLSV